MLIPVSDYSENCSLNVELNKNEIITKLLSTELK